MVLYVHQIVLKKPYEKKSSLDGQPTESPVLLRWVVKSLDEYGLRWGESIFRFTREFPLQN